MRSTKQCPWRLVPAVLVGATLLGCNASANLNGIAAASARPVMRYDQFQAAAASSTVMVTVGNGGVVVASGDGGKSWVRKVVDPSAALIGAAACPDGSFVALDFQRKVWVGDAAAREWAAKPLASQFNPLAVTCDARGRYWVVGSNSTILVSADKGASWKETALGQDAMLMTVQFVDENNGFITGEFGTLLATRDGGESWQAGPKMPNDFYPYSALFTDTRTGWVSGLAGTILHTGDGGATWEKQNNPTGAPMYGFARHKTDYYAVGVNGLLLKLSGNDWRPVETKPAPYLRAALSTADGLLVAGGAGALEIVASPASAAAK